MTDEEVLDNIQNQAKPQMNREEEKKFQELLRKFSEEVESKKTLKGKTRNCPSCRIPVEKIGG